MKGNDMSNAAQQLRGFANHPGIGRWAGCLSPSVARDINAVLDEREELLDEVADLQLQCQALTMEIREWLCDDCNTVYPGPPQPGFRCVICPKCGGKTGPRPTIEGIRMGRARRADKREIAALASASVRLLHELDLAEEQIGERALCRVSVIRARRALAELTADWVPDR